MRETLGGRQAGAGGVSVCGLGKGASALGGRQPHVWRGEHGWVSALSWVGLCRSQPVLRDPLLWLGMARVRGLKGLEKEHSGDLYLPYFSVSIPFCKTYSQLLTYSLTTVTRSCSYRLVCHHDSAPSFGLTMC